MQNSSINAMYIELARDPDWAVVAQSKVFDAKQTSIVRVFRHVRSGAHRVYATHSTAGKADGVSLEAVAAGSDVAGAVRQAAAEAKCVEGAVSEVIGKL